MKDYEHKIQVTICQYLDLLGICYWAVPNGGQRNKAVAAKLKREGAKAGVPDLTVIHKGQYYGIEVKTPKTHLTKKGKLSDSQERMIPIIERHGGIVGVVYGVPDVKQFLTKQGIIK